MLGQNRRGMRGSPQCIVSIFLTAASTTTLSHRHLRTELWIEIGGQTDSTLSLAAFILLPNPLIHDILARSLCKAAASCAASTRLQTTVIDKEPSRLLVLMLHFLAFDR